LIRLLKIISGRKGRYPGFKGYNGFPATLCTSLNDEVVHGIPGDRVLKNGDIVSIDAGALKMVITETLLIRLR